MANRRPMTMFEPNITAKSREDSQLSGFLKEESKQVLIQLLGTNCQTFCTASARVSLKSGSELVSRYLGHLCLVHDKTVNDNSKQLRLFDLDKHELIWTQNLSDNMEMTERDKNSLSIKIDDGHEVKLKFQSDYEAKEFFESAKVTIRVRAHERRRRSLFERATSFHGLLGSNLFKKYAELEISAPQPTDEQLQILRKSESDMKNRRQEKGSTTKNRHFDCDQCIHTCGPKEVPERRSFFAIADLLTRSRLTGDAETVEMDISAPYKVSHSEHLSPECCENLGYANAPELPKPKVAVARESIGTPTNFDHVAHFSVNPLQVTPKDWHSLPLYTRAMDLLHIPTNKPHYRKSSTENIMPAIAEMTSESDDHHACPSCIHNYHQSLLMGGARTGRKPSLLAGEAEISGPFDMKHVCHINADCKYVNGLKPFDSMPPLVPPPPPKPSMTAPVARARKFNKLDIGEPFDFKHTKHVGLQVKNEVE